MKIVSVLAQKGGAGKTTLTLHWAVAASTTRRKVAVVDIDPQGSSSSWGRRRESETPIVLQPGDGELEAALEACKEAGIDLALVDTMPRIEAPCIEAARLANLVVIPCGPSVVDIEAIGATISIAEKVGTPAIIVLNQGRAGSPINEKAAQALEGYGLPICPTVVVRRAALADAFIDGRAVMELEPKGKASREIQRTWKWIFSHVK